MSELTDEEFDAFDRQDVEEQLAEAFGLCLECGKEITTVCEKGRCMKI